MISCVYHPDIRHRITQNVTPKLKTNFCKYNGMIISCRGIQRNHHVTECAFVYDGNWGDSELIEHEKFHKALLDETGFWLGFEASQPFGIGRDGKIA